MSTRLKRNLGMLFATAVFFVAALAALPGEAEAQEALPGEAQSTPPGQDIPMQDAGTTNRGDSAAPDRQPNQLSETRVVEPGDTLWTITQEHLGQNKSPDLIYQEVGRIYELNRERIGNNPDLILPGQELLLTERTVPAVDVAVPDPTTTPAEETATPEQPTETEATPESAEDGSATKPSSTDSSSKANPEPSYPEASTAEQDAPDALTLLIQSGLFLGALAVALFGAWKIHTTRRLLTARREPRAGQYRSVYGQDDHYLSLYPQQETNDTATDAPTRDVSTAADAPEPTAVGSRNSERGSAERESEGR